MKPLILLLLLSALLFPACAAVPVIVKPVLQDEGAVSVYLEPFPAEAGSLWFTIDHISAVNREGVEFPLSLVVTEFASPTMRRQRLIASATLPPGQYIGLSYTLKKATLSGEEGAADLLVPDDPVRTEFTFEIKARKAVVLSLALRYRESVQGGISFTPRFSLFIPPMPAAGLLGYAVNRNDNSITVFDKKSGHVAAIIATGRGPEGIALDQQARRIYVSLQLEDAIDVIDLLEGVIINRINLKAGDGPRDILLTPDRRFLLSLNAASRTLSIIDPGSFVELSRVPVGEGPRYPVLGPAGIRCYVFNRFSNSITVIDIANSAVVATIPTDAGPLMGQFNRKGDRLYVIHDGSPFLSVIDPSPSVLSVVKKVFTGPGLAFIKVDSATDLLYGYRRDDVRLEVYDPFTLLPSGSIRATSGIVYMAIDDEQNILFALSADKKLLMAINLVSKKVVSETDVGENPGRVTMMGER